MRQMFTSPRLENVERVAALLNEAGIETKLVGGRSWKGYSRRQFSYADKKAQKAEEHASVWVVKPDDYKRARELMHELGLLEDSAPASFLPEGRRVATTADKAAAAPQDRVLKIKMGLLFVLVVIAGGMVLRMLFFRH